MICPGCTKENDPKRRYCGRCGTNFSPVCRRCSFANANDDRYCGGCGANLVAKDVHVKQVVAEGSAAHAMPVPPPIPAVAHAHHTPPAIPAIPMIPAVPAMPALTKPGNDELSGLFSSPVATNNVSDVALPETGVSQDDLDRLFGVAL